MKIVIADDFTGAAEIGGIAIKYGLSVEIFTKWPIKSNADLVIFDSNTRSKSEEEAKEITSELIEYVNTLKPDWLFKKIDSALRGHIIEETIITADFLKNKSAIIIPANPPLGRLINEGIYYINETPIVETSFANDPELSLESSKVSEILSKNRHYPRLHYCKSEYFQEDGDIFIGEVKNNADMKAWASIERSNTLQVGSASFFEAILEHDKLAVHRDPAGSAEKMELKEKDIESKTSKRLMICGSAYTESRKFVGNAKKEGLPVCYMSDEVFENTEIDEDELEKWKNEILFLLEKNNEAIIAIGHPVVKDERTSALLRKKMARVVQKVYEECEMNELLIEGGATASEIMNVLKISSLQPVFQYNQGVIGIKVKERPNLTIILKPGSYEWPEQLIISKI